MSKNETPMTIWYWEQIGGTLIEEFPVILSANGAGRRAIDGLIILGDTNMRLSPGAMVNIEGKDVVLIQAKNSRLGMSLMGQTLFSIELIKYHNPKSIVSVALCRESDSILQPLLEAHNGCKVVVYKPNLVG